MMNIRTVRSQLNWQAASIEDGGRFFFLQTMLALEEVAFDHSDSDN